MTIRNRPFTDAEIEAMAQEGWHFGLGLDWRQFVGKRKPKEADQPETGPPPAPAQEPDKDDEG